jgi:hypothetical protein
MPHITTPSDGAASLLVATLERTWQTIRTRHPDVPQAVLVIASGAEGKRLNLGHFAPTAGRSMAPTATRSWSAAKASSAARSTCSARCSTRLPMA